MLSGLEKETVERASKDLSSELQIILLLVSRLTRTPADVVLNTLRDVIADWQADAGEPE